MWPKNKNYLLIVGTGGAVYLTVLCLKVIYNNIKIRFRMGSQVEDFFLYVSSADNKDVFTENEPHNFHCIIEDGVNLTEGRWEVAVTEYYYYPDDVRTRLDNISRPIYLMCNFVKNSFTPKANSPILKRLYVSGFEDTRLNNKVYVPEYHDVSVASLGLLRLYIVDNWLSRLQLPHGVLAVTLHFRLKRR